MINKSIILILGFSIFCNIAFANTFKFETKSIEIFKEKKKILAGKGKAISSNNDLEINADKFEYLKDLDLLKTDGNGKAIIKSKDLIIKFDSALFDQKNSTINANGNIKINRTDKKFFIETEKIFYDQSNNLIRSDTKTKIKDLFKNTYVVDSFVFEINKDLLKVINLETKDKDNNIIKTEIAFINTQSGKLFGKDVNIDFSKSYFGADNEPA